MSANNRKALRLNMIGLANRPLISRTVWGKSTRHTRAVCVWPSDLATNVSKGRAAFGRFPNSCPTCQSEPRASQAAIAAIYPGLILGGEMAQEIGRTTDNVRPRLHDARLGFAATIGESP